MQEKTKEYKKKQKNTGEQKRKRNKTKAHKIIQRNITKKNESSQKKT